MLTMSRFRDIADCRLFRDDIDPLTWYTVPFTPRIALDDNNKPILSMVWYRRPLQNLTEEERKNRLGGGILTMSAELKPDEAQEKEIRETLAADANLHRRLEAQRGPWWRDQIRRDQRKLAEALILNALPVKEGTVKIAILAETAPEGGKPGDFIANLIGGGRVSMLGNQRASFMAKLTQEGAVLLWEMLERDLPAVRVEYDLAINHRLDAVRMIVWADAKKTYSATQELWQNLRDQASWSVRRSGNSTRRTFDRDQSHRAGDQLRIVAESNQASFVKIVPEGDASAVTPEQIQTLTQVGNEMIAEFLSKTILDYKPGEQATFGTQPELKTELAEHEGKKYGSHSIDFYSLKTWNESMEATLSHTFTSKAVLEAHLAPNDNLSNVLGGRDVKEFRTQIEIDAKWYQFLSVELVCTADFDNDPVDLVKAHLDYRGRGEQGDITTVKDFVFTKKEPTNRFSTYLASPRQRTYDYEYTVHYKGTDKTMTVRDKSDGTVLVLDVDRMGVLRVEVEVGLIDFAKIKAAFVKMWYGAGSSRVETEFTLDAQRLKSVWSAVIAAPVTDAYHYQVTFVDTAGQRIAIPQESSRSKQLVINQPVQEDLEVTVIPAGAFGADGLISKVVVALRYRDEANNYNANDTIVLSAQAETKTWTVPLVNKTLRKYDYQTTVFYSDGVTREDGWETTDKPILAVGDPFGFRVQISPSLLKNKGLSFALLTLRFSDTGIQAEKTLEISDFTKPLFWRFRLAAPDRHTYRYQLTMFKEDGTEVALPEREESKEVLVLKPV